MRSAKHVLLAAGLCMAFLSACHTPQLPATESPATPSSATGPTIAQSSPAEDNLPDTLSCESSSAEGTPTFSTTEEVLTSTVEEATSTSPPPSTKEVNSTFSPPSTEEITTTSPPATEEATTTSSPTAEEVTTPSPPTTTEEVTTVSPAPTTEEVTTPPPPSTEETVTTAEPDTAPAPVLNRGHAEEAFQLQNQLVSAQAVIPLQWSESLYQIAAQRVQEITIDYSHAGCPDWVAENILMGTNSPDLAVQIWYDSPGHQRNMLAGWTYGAIANYGFYWVAIYAMAECP